VKSFVPRLEVLPEAQRQLWPELRALAQGFVLYGGTALALRLGHRTSIDFDLFSSEPLNRQQLDRVPFVAGAQVLQDEPDTLTLSLVRGQPVKVSLFGSIRFGRVGNPEDADSGVPVASLLDLAATKIKVLLQLVEAKDYLDLAAVLRSGLALENVLGAARSLFGDAFNPLMAKKTLAWFEGEGLEAVDQQARALLTQAALRDLPVPLVERLSETLE
jgi:Nucleotidyl transferase AbiEii toxin, Type IV TA system